MEVNHTIPFSIKLRHVFWIVGIIIVLLVNPSFGDDDNEFKLIHDPIFNILSISGMKAHDKKSLIAVLKENPSNNRYVLTISMKFGGTTITADFKDYSDIPEKSMKFDCPKMKGTSIVECYFIKYEEDK